MGIIRGTVVYANGLPSPRSWVNASISGTPPAATDRVRTDAQGHFTLTWSGDRPAAVVFCDGGEAARNVRSGTMDLRLVTAD